LPSELTGGGEAAPQAVSTYSSPPAEESVGTAEFDPFGHTVTEVIDYAEDHPDEIERLIQEERSGKNRSTLITHLEAM
jgi:hypothetical protein